MTIQETPNYTLQTGKSLNEKVEGETYQIINKKYNVVEVETTMLPQAIKFLHDLEAGLAAVQDMFTVEEKKENVLPLHPGRPRVN
jgi:uncharacterized protein (UPF0128 family)